MTQTQTDRIYNMAKIILEGTTTETLSGTVLDRAGLHNDVATYNCLPSPSTELDNIEALLQIILEATCTITITENTGGDRASLHTAAEALPIAKAP